MSTRASSWVLTESRLYSLSPGFATSLCANSRWNMRTAHLSRRKTQALWNHRWLHGKKTNVCFHHLIKNDYILRCKRWNVTRKPCWHKETARCRKCSFRLKFANNIPYKYKTRRASKATLQSSKHAGAKHNLTQNQDSKSFKVTCLESVEKQW